MAENKTTLSIGLNVDTASAKKSMSEVEKIFADSIKNIQAKADKLKIAPTASAAKPPSPPGSPAYQAYHKEMEATRSKENKNRVDFQAYQMVNRNLTETARLLTINARLSATEAKTEKDKLFYSTERNRLEKEYQTLLGTKLRMQQTSFRQPGAQAQTSGGVGGGGIGGFKMPSSITGAIGMMGPVGAGIAGGRAAPVSVCR